MAGRATSRSDDEIQRDVLAELAREPRVQPNEIGVAVQDGVVTLRGWVENYARKWAAERAAQRVRPVRAVANDLEVRLPSSAERDDPEIAAAVTRTLEWDAFVPASQVDVTVSTGWVVLRGEVEWEYQRRAAEQAVRRLAGVRGLTNGISVRPHEVPEPDEISERIRSALVRSVETDAAGIELRIEGDSVVLTGDVRSWLEREEAERVAWSAPGVANVDNHITVRR
ncbi:BON domain-containing protein [Plantactinospora sp. WMMB334]|uniref:BON domain-containing protein n=1 Tax=Plantactinospora sp. WMMB334 TaxID=3404119 RepID=UPI003B940735